jgi:hypothetical protein
LPTFEASKTLALAGQAVELALARTDAEGSALKALRELEKGWERAINKIAERASMTKRFCNGDVRSGAARAITFSVFRPGLVK